MLTALTIAALGGATALAEDGTETPDRPGHHVRLVPGVFLSPMGAKLKASWLLTDLVSVQLGGGYGRTEQANQWTTLVGGDLHLSGGGFRGVYIGPRLTFRERSGPAAFTWWLGDVAHKSRSYGAVLGHGWVSDNGLAFHMGAGVASKRQVVVAKDLQGGVLQGITATAEFGLGLAILRRP